MKPQKVRRCATVRRMCHLCAVPYPETEYPEDGWTCRKCRDEGVQEVIPLKKCGEGERYDTTALFAGYRVFKVPKGERTDYETEVRSPAGEVYACGGAAVALYTRSLQMANKLAREFPAAQIVTTGDDGRCVVRFPAHLFPALAKRIGVFKPRQVSEEMRTQLVAARAKAKRPEKAEVPAPSFTELEKFEDKARQMGLDL
jgi:hypothetical protein